MSGLLLTDSTLLEMLHNKSILACPPGVMRIAVEGWLDLLNRSLCATSGCLVEWDSEVAWAAPYGDGGASPPPVAVVVFKVQSHNQRAWISLGYTRPGFRRRGIYRRMYEDLREKLAARGVVAIDSSIALTNVESRGMAASLGRVETAVHVEDNLQVHA